jgi:DNA-binding transcriptional regulator GbsR (MarR family)
MNIIKTAILSFTFIFLFHNLYLFFKDNLTVPKVKDLVATTDEKYNDILSVINNDEDNSASKLTDNINTDEMKNELKDYIKNISVNNQMLNDTTNII